MTTENLLAKLSSAEVQYLPLGDIVDNEALQKRRPSEMDERSQREDEAERKRLIKDIADSLADDPEFQSHPLKVVRCVREADFTDFVVSVEPQNYLVDGFHRYAAYERAGRQVVPVQLVEGSWLQAEDVATILNRHSRTVPLDPNQQRQQAWEMVNRHFSFELGKLKPSMTARRIAKQAGVNHQTVNNMVKKAAELGASASSLTWKRARSNAEFPDFDAAQRLRQIVRATLDLAGKVQGDHELETMIRVLQDERDGVLGYNPDIDAYVERLMAEAEEELAF